LNIEVKRLRISSNDPQELNDELIDLERSKESALHEVEKLEESLEQERMESAKVKLVRKLIRIFEMSRRKAGNSRILIDVWKLNCAIVEPSWLRNEAVCSACLQKKKAAEWF
jgi:hypothetical protein